jgi:hypothetical protein
MEPLLIAIRLVSTIYRAALYRFVDRGLWRSSQMMMIFQGRGRAWRWLCSRTRGCRGFGSACLWAVRGISVAIVDRSDAGRAGRAWPVCRATPTPYSPAISKKNAGAREPVSPAERSGLQVLLASPMQPRNILLRSDTPLVLPVDPSVSLRRAPFQSGGSCFTKSASLLCVVGLAQFR